MNASPEQFPFVSRNPALGSASLVPILPITLTSNQQRVAVSGLLDTGAALNVLPYGIGTQLGLQWDQQSATVRLAGNLASVEARVVVMEATVGTFPAVQLAFAWAKEDAVPLLLGQVNFFIEFDVCFFRSRSVFEVRPKSSP